MIGRANPLVVIRRESPAGHDAVNVGMRLQRLPPGMQDAQESDLRAEVFRSGGDFQQGRCAGVEQELEEHFLVLPDEGNQRMWHAEDQVVIVGRKQLLPAGGQPLVTSVGLALTTSEEARLCLSADKVGFLLRPWSGQWRLRHEL